MCTFRSKPLDLCTYLICCVSVMYYYTRSFNYFSHSNVYSFTPKVPPVRDSCFSMRSRHDFRLKSSVCVHNSEVFIDFVHITGGSSGVSCECIFNIRSRYMSKQFPSSSVSSKACTYCSFLFKLYMFVKHQAFLMYNHTRKSNLCSPCDVYLFTRKYVLQR